MDYLVEGSLEWAPLALDDLPQLAELRQAIEYFDDPVDRQDLEELYQQFTAAEDPGRDAVVGRDRGRTIVAYGWNHPGGLPAREPRVWLDGGVHPAWRHKQIGRRLIEWQVERAQEWFREQCAADPSLAGLRLRVGAHVDERQTGAAQLLKHGGFHPMRWYFDMHASFTGDDGQPLPMVPIGDLGGVQLQPFHPELSERVRRAHNEVFSATLGSHRVTRAVWEESLARGAARPQWSWVAMDAGQVVGYAMNSAYGGDWDTDGPSEGWTDRLGVLPGWRRRGIATALLQASMRSFRDAGLQGAGLGIDTDRSWGAVMSFEGLGYVRDEMVVLHVREFPGGAVTG